MESTSSSVTAQNTDHFTTQLTPESLEHAIKLAQAPAYESKGQDDNHIAEEYVRASQVLTRHGDFKGALSLARQAVEAATTDTPVKDETAQNVASILDYIQTHKGLSDLETATAAIAAIHQAAAIYLEPRKKIASALLKAFKNCINTIAECHGVEAALQLAQKEALYTDCITRPVADKLISALKAKQATAD